MTNQAVLQVVAVGSIAYITSTLLGCGAAWDALNIGNVTTCLNNTMHNTTSKDNLKKYNPMALANLTKLCPRLNLEDGIDMLKDSNISFSAVCDGAAAIKEGKCIVKGILSAALPGFKKCCEPIPGFLQEPCEGLVDTLTKRFNSDEVDECKADFPDDHINTTKTASEAMTDFNKFDWASLQFAFGMGAIGGVAAMIALASYWSRQHASVDFQAPLIA